MSTPPTDPNPQSTLTITGTQLRDGNGYPTQIGSYLNITGDTTTLVKTGNGFLYSITINNPTATEVITLYDNTAASGTKIGTITIPSGAVPVTLDYDINFLIGLTIVTGTASSDITISYR